MHQNQINFISYAQAAKMLGVAVVTIKKWAQKGIIKRYAVTGRSVFVDKDE
ncbi:helix-turn-helix domain-containing protein, partial [Campylobacter showae]